MNNRRSLHLSHHRDPLEAAPATRYGNLANTVDTSGQSLAVGCESWLSRALFTQAIRDSIARYKLCVLLSSACGGP